MKCAFLGAKIASFPENAKRLLLKVVKGLKKVVRCLGNRVDGRIGITSFAAHSSPTVWLSSAIIAIFGKK
jgi:hypothetical protein